jgi:FixJ family two-component response regulator
MLLIPVRVLVIDDDDAVCRRLGSWLREAGCDAVTFTSAVEGLAHIARAACQVAYVDLRLAEGDGVAVIAALAKLPAPPRIVALGAFPDARQVIAAMRAGAADLLEKPVQREPLLAALEQQLAAAGLFPRSEEEFNRRLGARLRSLRAARERTLADVAGECGMTASQLSQIELGKCTATSWALARICGALRIPLQRAFAED